MVHIQEIRHPTCPLCTEHVELETANTDEKGRAVHEDCYVGLILAQSRTISTNPMAIPPAS